MATVAGHVYMQIPAICAPITRNPGAGKDTKVIALRNLPDDPHYVGLQLLPRRMDLDISPLRINENGELHPVSEVDPHLGAKLRQRVGFGRNFKDRIRANRSKPRALLDTKRLPTFTPDT